MSKSFSIVSMQHCGSEEIVAALKTGTVVTLVREPNNQYDPNAVMVWCDGIHIGYIPKKQNKDLAARIDATGKHWTKPSPVLAQDAPTPTGITIHKAINAKFIRSPNSGYPMVNVAE
jgi:hypothetical protein